VRLLLELVAVHCVVVTTLVQGRPVSVMYKVHLYLVCVCDVIDEAELAFLNSLISFAHQMMSLRLTDSQLALLCALVLVNPSECL